MVRGRVAASTVELLSARFAALSIARTADGEATALSGDMDRATERALLTLLWDMEHDVVAVSHAPDEGRGGDGDG